jgi:hypothetical protein
VRFAFISRVGERRGVAAGVAEVEGERPVLHPQLVRDQLLAVPVVAGDDAGHGLLTRIAVVDPNRHAIANAEHLPALRMVELDLGAPHADQVARLPRPREVLEGVAA